MFTVRALKNVFSEQDIRGIIYVRKTERRTEVTLAVPNDKMMEVKNIIVEQSITANKMITLPWWSNRFQRVKIKPWKS